VAWAEKASIEVVGIKEFLRKLRTEELLGDDWRNAMRDIGEAGKRAAEAAAPTGATGDLRRSISYRVSGAVVPRYVVVKTTATHGKKRYPYPRLLEFAPKYHHTDWLKGAMEAASSSISSALTRAAAQIAAHFASK
jgi:hypothetical protein